MNRLLERWARIACGPGRRLSANRQTRCRRQIPAEDVSTQISTSIPPISYKGRVRLIACFIAAAASAVLAPAVVAGQPADHPPDQVIAPPAAAGPATGLADSAALRATVYGTPPQDIAPMPAKVPLLEINFHMPWARPVPDVFWFGRDLRVWFSSQDKPAPLAIVISGTGGDGNTTVLSTLRGALYGAGYHVLTMPSPTFPGFIVSASTTGVAGDLVQDGHDLYSAMQRVVAHLPGKVRITDIDIL